MAKVTLMLKQSVKLRRYVLCGGVATCVFTLDAGLLARSQYPEGPKTGLLDTGFSWFPWV
jgi:hypothetical protein